MSFFVTLDVGKYNALYNTLPFEKVSNANELAPALEKALAIDGPVLVEVDINSVGEIPRYFSPPPYAQKSNNKG